MLLCWKSTWFQFFVAFIMCLSVKNCYILLRESAMLLFNRWQMILMKTQMQQYHKMQTNITSKTSPKTVTYQFEN